ncbi:hypothetical protein HY478_04145 [Candidatus Uhrbacteria bacterium]|nr:hypothetical protein [Candidatus Uhrbacteria bacterium]
MDSDVISAHHHVHIETVSPRAARRRIITVGLAIVLFFAYAYLAVRAPQGVWNSPDEMANAYFTARFAEESVLHTLEPLEGVARGTLHPRSIAVVEEFLVPGGFHGLAVIYGLIAKVTGFGFLDFVTPLVAVLAVCAWRRLIEHLFGDRAGTIAAAVLAVTPAWWYWTNRGLYHNVLFVALLIFAAYFFVVRPLRAHLFQAENLLAIKLRRLTPLFDPFVAGLALGAAWWVRTAEITWTALGAVLLLICARRAHRWRELFAFVVAVGIAFAPALVLNDALYGSPLRTGYAPTEVIASAVSLRGGGADETISAEIATAPSAPRDDRNNSSAIRDVTNTLQATSYKLQATLFPFGFHPRTALNHFIDYGVRLHWGMTIMLAAALLWCGYEFLRGRSSREHTVLVILFGAVTAWLVSVYGSWVVRDNPDPGAITIGISYSRYWLPAFVLGSGVIGVASAHWTERLRTRVRGVLLAAGLILFAVFSFYIVFLTTGDGLFAVNKTLHGYARVRADVLARTAEESVIVVDRGDKIFFPDRRVITPLRDERTYEVLRALSVRVPLYYYGITMTDEDLKFHNEVKLLPLGVSLELVSTYDGESLYRFKER